MLEDRDEEVESEGRAGHPHQRVHLAPEALRRPDDDVGDEAERDAVGDRERERHHHDRQRGAEAEREILEVDAGDHAACGGDCVAPRRGERLVDAAARRAVLAGQRALLDVGLLLRLGENGDHQVGDDDQRGRGCLRRHHPDQRRDEHEREEERSGDDAHPARAPADADARGGLDVRRRRRGRGEPADAGGERVDEQRLLDLRQLASLVEVAGLLADADERAHRVEEVADHQREDEGDRGDERQRRERVEADLADQTEVGRVEDVVRPARVARAPPGRPRSRWPS